MRRAIPRAACGPAGRLLLWHCGGDALPETRQAAGAGPAV